MNLIRTKANSSIMVIKCILRLWFHRCSRRVLEDFPKMIFKLIKHRFWVLRRQTHDKKMHLQYPKLNSKVNTQIGCQHSAKEMKTTIHKYLPSRLKITCMFQSSFAVKTEKKWWTILRRNLITLIHLLNFKLVIIQRHH